MELRPKHLGGRFALRDMYIAAQNTTRPAAPQHTHKQRAKAALPFGCPHICRVQSRRAQSGNHLRIRTCAATVAMTLVPDAPNRKTPPDATRRPCAVLMSPANSVLLSPPAPPSSYWPALYRHDKPLATTVENAPRASRSLPHVGPFLPWLSSVSRLTDQMRRTGGPFVG
jgi:hypothetical protein